MVLIKLYAADIDYNMIVGLATPLIAKGLSDKNSISGNILKNIISRNGKQSGLSKLLVKALPNKEQAAASILPHFEESLVGLMNELLIKNNITAKVKALSFRANERNRDKMLKIEIIIDDIDYEQSAVNLAPLILMKLSEQDSITGRTVRLLLGKKELTGSVLAAAIGAVPKQQRDELLADIVNEYRVELSGHLNRIIADNNIKAEIRSLKADSVLS